MRTLIACTLVLMMQSAIASRAEERIESNYVNAAVIVKLQGEAIAITEEVTHPEIGDFDADGRQDLLIGELRGRGGDEDGRLRIYRNLSDSGSPNLTQPVRFDEIVPSAIVPDG